MTEQWVARAGTPTMRPPKTAELVAHTLRRMIVDGALADGDFLPHEAELMTQFNVSRPTLREAVRVLEAERLVEVRRGSRTGARIRVPGAEIVARPAGLLLELAGATLADVFAARAAVEPAAARLLAARRDHISAAVPLQALLDDLPGPDDPMAFADATVAFHLAMVDGSGNATLSVVAGMLAEITERHTRHAITTSAVNPRAYRALHHSYGKIIDLVRDGNAEGAELHWRAHMKGSGEHLLRGLGEMRVVDVLR